MTDQPLEQAESAIEGARQARDDLPEGVIDEQPEVPNNFDGPGSGEQPDDDSDDDSADR